ncbi:ABC transporter substrate-binding protein [Roseomonas sp. 18066]|uniref:ABC transporter substrate-binding protein n=1 Tax=Roseomonas sp. 18066 TaxID=2681412 RepID=UPI00135BF887|nr:ABC transporter substrate-binding protein [Roseomonas sp. 18066]
MRLPRPSPPPLPTRRHALLLGAALGVVAARRRAAAQSGFYVLAPADDPWAALAQRARGQVVHFHAWAGDEPTNAFIAWAAARLRVLHDITLVHVRVSDIGALLARLAPPAPEPPAEPVPEPAAAGADPLAVADTAPPLDLFWFGGPHLLTPAQRAALRPVAATLPNFRLVDAEGKPGTVTDFTLPVEGRAVPWRLAQAVFLYDSAKVPHPPLSMLAMPDWARAHPGRLTHPQPRDPLGAAFLKQALYEIAPHEAVLAKPASDDNFTLVTAPLWEWYATLRPHLWQQGRRFPEDAQAQGRLLQQGEVDLVISLNPAEASMAIAAGFLRDSIRSYVPTRGSIGNASFLGIPEQASQPDAAMVVADFFLSPEAQAEAQDPDALGSPTILDLARLSEADRQRFESLPAGVATLSNAALGASLPEPHPSWGTRLADEWEKRKVGRGD